MPIIEVDAQLEKQIQDEYYSWKRAQGFSINTLLPRGGPDNRNMVTLHNVEQPFLDYLTKKAIPFTRLG